MSREEKIQKLRAEIKILSALLDENSKWPLTDQSLEIALEEADRVLAEVRA